jgi:hypothetical protein
LNQESIWRVLWKKQHMKKTTCFYQTLIESHDFTFYISKTYHETLMYVGHPGIEAVTIMLLNKPLFRQKTQIINKTCIVDTDSTIKQNCFLL